MKDAQGLYNSLKKRRSLLALGVDVEELVDEDTVPVEEDSGGNGEEDFEARAPRSDAPQSARRPLTRSQARIEAQAEQEADAAPRPSSGRGRVRRPLVGIGRHVRYNSQGEAIVLRPAPESPSTSRPQPAPASNESPDPFGPDRNFSPSSSEGAFQTQRNRTASPQPIEPRTPQSSLISYERQGRESRHERHALGLHNILGDSDSECSCCEKEDI